MHECVLVINKQQSTRHLHDMMTAAATHMYTSIMLFTHSLHLVFNDNDF